MMLDKAQRHALRMLRRNNGGIVFHKAGEGKTRIAVRWFKTVEDNWTGGLFRPRFLVVTRRDNFEDWRKEVRKLGYDWTVCDYLKDVGQSKATKLWLLSHGMIHKLEDARDLTIDAIALDEGWLYKNAATKHAKSARKITNGIPSVILSGSVMTAKNLEDVFGQLFAINRNESVARTLTEFRSKFMFKYQITLKDGRSFDQWEANQRALATVTKLIGDFTSVSHPKGKIETCEHIVNVEPSKEQAQAFNDLKTTYFTVVKERELEIKHAPVLIIKLQQISDGYCSIGGELLRIPSGKLTQLLTEVIKDVKAGHRVVVWCAFRKSVDIILHSLQKLKIRGYGMHGSLEFDSKGWALNGQVAVATTGSGSSFNYFSQVSRVYYYSMSPKWLNLQQSMLRTVRKDSQHSKCEYFFLETKGGMDSYVRRIAQSSGSRERELLDKLKLWATSTE